MEITSYYLAKLITKEVLIRSTDYYARHGDTSEETVQVLEVIGDYKDQEQAFDKLKELKEESKEYKQIKGDYTILPIYSI